MEHPHLVVGGGTNRPILKARNDHNVVNTSLGDEQIAHLLKSRTPKRTAFRLVDNYDDQAEDLFNFDTSPKAMKNDENEFDFTENIRFNLPPRLQKRLREQNQTKRPANKPETALNIPNPPPPKLDSPPIVSRRETVFLRKKETHTSKNVSAPLEDVQPKQTRDIIKVADLNRAEEDERYVNWYNSIVKTNFTIEDVVVGDFMKLINLCLQSDKANDGVTSKADVSGEEVRLVNLVRQRARTFYNANVRDSREFLIEDIKLDRFFIRPDKNVHQDLGMQRHIVDVLSNYSPLWLWIAFECVFNTEIPIANEKNPVHRLYKALTYHFFNFRDLFDKARCKNATTYFMKQTNVIHAKRHILSNFLLMVHFLDRAKSHKLIEHNPCLFRSDASFKSSRDIVIQFSREYITGVGDIIKALNKTGMPLSFAQARIEEFDFISHCLAADFACGTRLARLVELIFNIDVLRLLQFPPNSISRKLHNINVIVALIKKRIHGFPTNFVSKDICNRNRERLISLLDILIEYHNQQLKLIHYRESEESVKKIQAWFRNHQLCKSDRQRFIRMRLAVITIQCRYRESVIALKERAAFLELRWAAVIIQQRWRACQVMAADRERYTALRKATIRIQRQFRANVKAAHERRRFLEKRCSAIAVQRFWRNVLESRAQRSHYLKVRESIIQLQASVRGFLARRRYQKLQQQHRAALIIQNRFRALLLGRSQRQAFQRQRNAASALQRFWRSVLQTRSDRASYLATRHCIVRLQSIVRGVNARRKYLNMVQANRAAVVLQRRWRARALMLETRSRFLAQRSATITIQRYWRCTQQSRMQRSEFLAQRQAAIIIQKHWRCVLVQRAFNHQVKLVISLQQHVRAYLLGEKVRRELCQLRNATLTVQRAWRAKLEMRRVRTEFLVKRNAACSIQRTFRKHRARKLRSTLISARNEAASKIQIRYRALLAGRQVRQDIAYLNSAALRIQRFFRDYRLGANFVQVVKHYQILVTASAVRIQAWFRANRQRKRLDRIEPRFIHIRIALRQAYARARYTEPFFSVVMGSLDRLSQTSTVLKMDKEIGLIERGTLIFPQVCLLIIEKDSILSCMVSSISLFNRSEPHQLLLFKIYGILKNIFSLRCVIEFDCYELIQTSMRIWKNYVKSNGLLVARVITVLRLVFARPNNVQYLRRDQSLNEFFKSSLQTLIASELKAPVVRNATATATKRLKSLTDLRSQALILYDSIKGPLKWQ